MHTISAIFALPQSLLPTIVFTLVSMLAYFQAIGHSSTDKEGNGIKMLLLAHHKAVVSGPESS